MNPRILLVEDDAIVARDVAETFDDLGYEIRGPVATGKEAIQAAREQELDLVLMDIRLSGELDGVDAAREIRSHSDVPVVYLTAYADDATLRKVTRGLPYGYVVKPYDARILRAAVEIALARYRLERQLRERERWFERLVANSHDIVSLVDEEGQIEYVSPAMERVLGHRADDWIGKRAMELVHPEERDTAREALTRTVESPNERVELDLRMRHADGGWREMNVVGQSFRGPESEIRVVVSVRDVTRIRDAVRQLRESEKRYRSLFEDNVAGTFQSTGDGEILAANTALARMLGYDSPKELERVRATSLYPDPKDRERLLERLREERSLSNLEIELRRKDGTSVWFLANLALRETDEGEVITGTVADISERKQLEAYLEELAFRDPLTGLANRRSLEREAERVLALAERSRRSAAVVYVDMARFKEINDTLGHAAGDAVLAEVARRLEGESRESDLVARIGGDEYAALLPEVDGPEGAAAVARRLAAALDSPVETEAGSVPVHAQFGVAIFPEHGRSFQELLSAADRAMYRAKAAARESIRFFDPESDVLLAGDDQVNRELREALASDQFVVHYQPIFEVRKGTVAGAEAFARWIHPERGLLSASEFVPEVERRGLAGDLDRRVVRRLVDDLDEWHPEDLPGWISVNLGITSLGDGEFRAWLSDTLRSGWPDAVRLVFDVSERTAVRHPDLLANVLSDLEDFPVAVALDDFGTGPGSVAFLEGAPATLVKVDPSFIRNLTMRRDRGRLARALVALGHAAGMEVALKGVEQKVQYETACRDGPDFVQGHYTGRPVAPDRFGERVVREPGDPPSGP